jgi:hypothetical protein
MFADASWLKDASTVTANTITAPNGTLTADTFTANGTANPHGIRQTGVSNLLSGVSYTTSIYAKKGTNNFIQIVGSTAPYVTSNVFANFDLNNGTVGTVGSSATATIQDVGDGWYRCTMTATAGATSSTNSYIIQLVSSASAIRGESNSLSTSVFLWGAQLVEGTEALPYFATTDRLNVPRLDYSNADGTLSTCPRLQLEPQRTNSIRNSSMVGAVAGSPGTLPTNWNTSTAAGLTQTVVATGIENGLPYIDLRFNGTASAASLRLATEPTSVIAALPGQIWSNSSYFRLTAGTLSQITLRNVYRNSGGGAITTPQQQFDLTSILTRRVFTDAAAPALTAFIQQEVLATLVIGTAYDFTIRIAAPQMELGAYATTWVPTTTAAVTRIADAASKTGVSSLIGQTEGTLFVDIIPTDVTTTNAIGINNASTTGRVIIFTGGNLIFGQVRVGAVTQFSVNTSATVGVRYKAAIAYKQNDFAFYLNGAQIAVSNTGTVPACSVISYDAGGDTSPFLGRNNQAALFPTRLTNAQLAQLTTL